MQFFLIILLLDFYFIFILYQWYRFSFPLPDFSLAIFRMTITGGWAWWEMRSDWMINFLHEQVGGLDEECVLIGWLIFEWQVSDPDRASSLCSLSMVPCGGNSSKAACRPWNSDLTFSISIKCEDINFIYVLEVMLGN